jgi:ATP-dependent DNA helicase RecG
LRENIFREVIINMLIHKEYSRAEPTRFIIEKKRVYTENSNKPYISGIIDLSNLVPHPKNPNIARFFRQIGRAEELGSGVRKIYKYCKAYSGYDPVITDDNDCFRFILQVDFFKTNT